MKAALRGAAPKTEFVVMKSYDGGKHWEQERWCPTFASAAGTAQALRTQNPAIRFRVDVAAASYPGRGNPARGNPARSAAARAARKGGAVEIESP